MRTTERRPHTGTGAQLTGQVHSSLAPATVNLALIREDYWRAFLAGYRDGHQHGVARTLDDIETTDDQAWAAMSARVRRQAASPRFSQLADRRGDHERAERARQWERLHGLAPIR